MSYPDSALTDGERVLVHQHSHWKTLLLPLTGLAVVVIVCGYTALTTAHQPLALGLVVAMVAAALVLGIAPWLRWKSTHFVVTSDRVMFREGVLRRDGTMIPLGRIANTRYERDINDRLFGCGTLIIESLADEPVAFDDIPSVEAVHTLLYQATGSQILTGW